MLLSYIYDDLEFIVEDIIGLEIAFVKPVQNRFLI